MKLLEIGDRITISDGASTALAVVGIPRERPEGTYNIDFPGENDGTLGVLACAFIAENHFIPYREHSIYWEYEVIDYLCTKFIVDGLTLGDVYSVKK